MRWILLFALSALVLTPSSASADFSYVRSMSLPPGTGDLTGVDVVDGSLFAVTGLAGQASCIYIIDPETGAITRQGCPDATPPGWPGEPLDFVSCAFISGGYLIEPLGTDGYWVGDSSGAIVRYHWNATHGFKYAGHCSPDIISDPVGLTSRGGLLYILDGEAAAIYQMKNCFGRPPDPIHLPAGVTDPSALCFYDGSWFVPASSGNVIYEINDEGILVDTHELRSFAPVPIAGMAFAGDYLFAASGNRILVFRFSDFGRTVNVPEGDDVVVTPLPDELEITFPTVVDSGSLYVHIHDTDPCPVPGGVVFLPDFYEIVTDASFEYIAQIALMTQSPLPPEVNLNRIRIFTRPSGECRMFMDITVAPIELYPEDGQTFRRLTRTLSEDDEFSFFVLAEDNRNPIAVVELKFTYLAAAIDAAEYHPPDPCQEMMDLFDAAYAAFGNRRYGRAARQVDLIAEVALATPEIPHTYTPDEPGSNLGGRIVAQAHTLSFSLRQVVSEQQHGDTFDRPEFALSRSSGLEVTLSPNPSASGFTVSLEPRAHETATVKVYSVSGELVRTLLDGEILSAPGTLTWDGRSGSGAQVEAGIYFIVVKAGEEAITRKLVLQR